MKIVVFVLPLEAPTEGGFRIVRLWIVRFATRILQRDQEDGRRRIASAAAVLAQVSEHPGEQRSNAPVPPKKSHIEIEVIEQTFAEPVVQHVGDDPPLERHGPRL